MEHFHWWNGFENKCRLQTVANIIRPSCVEKLQRCHIKVMTSQITNNSTVCSLVQAYNKENTKAWHYRPSDRTAPQRVSNAERVFMTCPIWPYLFSFLWWGVLATLAELGSKNLGNLGDVSMRLTVTWQAEGVHEGGRSQHGSTWRVLHTEQTVDAAHHGQFGFRDEGQRRHPGICITTFNLTFSYGTCHDTDRGRGTSHRQSVAHKLPERRSIHTFENAPVSQNG